jgi:hypothetical protein
VGQHKRKSSHKERRPYASRADREYGQVCLHEAAHAVAAVMTGCRCGGAAVWDLRRGRIGSSARLEASATNYSHELTARLNWPVNSNVTAVISVSKSSKKQPSKSPRIRSGSPTLERSRLLITANDVHTWTANFVPVLYQK